MATTAKTVETELQNRLRIGTAETAISDANLFSVMNYVQRTLNYAFARDVSTGTYLASDTKTVLSFATASIGTDFYAVLSMYTDNNSLYKCPNWNALQQYDSSWRTAGAEAALVWAPVGRNMLAVYPASSQTYNVVYIRETTAVNSSGDSFTIPDADITLLTDICELIWLTHLRQLAEAKLKVTRIAENLRVSKEVKTGNL